MSDRTEQLYDFLFGEEEGRSCDAIPEEACRVVPGNALKNVTSGAFSKLAEQLAHPGLTIPWLLSSIGVAPAITALLLPLKDAGSLSPQLFLAAEVRHRPRRNRLWAGAAMVQAALLLLMATALALFPPLWAGASVALLFLIFGVSSGVGSLSFKDTLGKTIPKPRRGTLLGLRASIGGAAALVAGLILARLGGAEAQARAFFALLILAAALWVVSGLFFRAVDERPGATGGARNPVAVVSEAFGLFREDGNIRRFVTARSLNLSIALLQPLYVIIAAGRLGFSFSGLGTLLIASAGAQLISGWVWGRLTDRSARFVLFLSPLLGVAVGVLFFLLPLLGGAAAGAAGHGVVIFLHNIAYAGARVGRKTYLVNASGDENRALLAAGANTLIGLATLLLSALVSTVTGVFDPAASAAMLLLLLTAGGLLALRLEEV